MKKHVVRAGPTGRGSTFRSEARCWLRFAYRYVLEYPVAEPTTGPLAIGSQVHEAFAQFFAKKLRPDLEWASPESRLRLDTARKAYQGAIRSMPAWLATAEIIAVEKHATLWFDEDGDMVPPPSDAEERLELAKARPVKSFSDGPYPHTMRRDLTVRLRDGSIRELDWKTCWTAGYQAAKDKLEGFSGNAQFTALDLFARAAHRPYGGTWAVLVTKAPPHRMVALDVSTDPVVRRRLGQLVVHQEQTLHRLMTTIPSPESWPAVLSEQGPCRDKYSICPFYAPCRGE